MEADLRKSPDLRGTEVELLNGERWTVPAIPLSKAGIALARTMADIKKEDAPLADTMERFLSFCSGLLRINYPEITDEQLDGLFDMTLLAPIMEAATGGLGEGKEPDPQT